MVIAFVTAPAMLMTFAQVRTLGAGLLASASVIGIVVGIAARRRWPTWSRASRSSISKPIRLDDVVVVEGEWGRIEEITFTYVVVASWDERRIVLPISWPPSRTPSGFELRVLVSAADAPRAWDLRCHVRERLVAFLAREHPDALPRVRAGLEEFAAPPG